MFSSNFVLPTFLEPGNLAVLKHDLPCESIFLSVFREYGSSKAFSEGNVLRTLEWRGRQASEGFVPSLSQSFAGAYTP